MSDLSLAMFNIINFAGSIPDGLIGDLATVMDAARLVANHPTVYYAIDTEGLGNGEKLHVLLVDGPGEYHVIPAALTGGDTR